MHQGLTKLLTLPIVQIWTCPIFIYFQIRKKTCWRRFSDEDDMTWPLSRPNSTAKFVYFFTGFKMLYQRCDKYIDVQKDNFTTSINMEFPRARIAGSRPWDEDHFPSVPM